jgi:hypothetical protein
MQKLHVLPAAEIGVGNENLFASPADSAPYECKRSVPPAIIEPGLFIPTGFRPFLASEFCFDDAG